MNQEENNKIFEFSKPLIKEYQEYMKTAHNENVSNSQACSDLNTLADLFSIFTKKSNRGSVKE